MKTFSVVVAATARKFGIGLKQSMPWKISADMKYFRDLTTKTVSPTKKNAVIMGRKTWESIPDKFRPLPERLNIILTTDVKSVSENIKVSENVKVMSSFEDALQLVNDKEQGEMIENVFVIGGGSVYKQALESPLCENIYLTKIYSDVECDTFFPRFDMSLFEEVNASDVEVEKDMRFQFMKYTRSGLEATAGLTDISDALGNEEENQYLNLIRNIIENGVERGDRTGTGTRSIFGAQMRFNLRNEVFPLLTTKRVFWRGVAEELLWFVSGDTSAKTLQDKNIKIWDGNSTRAYLDSIGLTDREEGDLGPVYGFQWRHFGATYKTMHSDYTGQGVDQLVEAVNKIKNKPNDRRIIVSAWNPAALPDMALPPCHMFCQFYVANGELSCQMYQRSCDMGLGVPFNIASYALLTRMVAHVCGLQAGEFIHTLGDAHVYLNHIEPLKKQLERVPRAFPKLRIKRDVKDIDSFQYEDFEIEGYRPYPKISMDMAV